MDSDSTKGELLGPNTGKPLSFYELWFIFSIVFGAALVVFIALFLLMLSLIDRWEKLSPRTAPDRVYAKDTLPVHNDFNASPRYTPLRSMLSTIVLPIRRCVFALLIFVFFTTRVSCKLSDLSPPTSLYSFFRSLSNFFFHRKDRNSLPEERSAGRSRELPRSATRVPHSFYVRRQNRKGTFPWT
ncbi:hypothetical protein M404DRAFT_999632 [Pisolithus tinctorius Marx 270]|uniref:Uncharacterized protein n=1 Tax=Pisolithus tinctorius Marx 270 TaxID=870435 RepID=A0A0C3PDP7_PISTI|nr:hypothetical protein M404DRAFT_999632 [Pisolithus tinctorius Marx 270]